ncbi:MAG: hypothetical protein KUG78_02030 [Kangiellaceae bacterium]|nr:hypothetical protein [Kangiellaceae bacterium]
MKQYFTKSIFLLIALCTANIVIAKETCDLKGIGLPENAAKPEQLYYLGTCHYRNQDYSKSVELWSELSRIKNLDPSFAELQINSLNNLGYLLFFGFGTHEDKKAAIDHWSKAISLGQTESEYHLCHAYGDKGASTYEPMKALSHCKKARLIYRGIEDKNDDVTQTLERINFYLKELGES